MQSISEISLTGHTTQYDSCRPRIKPHSHSFFFQIRKIMNLLMCYYTAIQTTNVFFYFSSLFAHYFCSLFECNVNNKWWVVIWFLTLAKVGKNIIFHNKNKPSNFYFLHLMKAMGPTIIKLSQCQLSMYWYHSKVSHTCTTSAWNMDCLLIFYMAHA